MFRTALCAALLSGLPGCSEGPEGFGPAPPAPSPTEGGTPAPSPSPPTIRVRAPGGLRFSPAQLRIRGGSTSAVEFHNLDQQPHTFVVDELNVLMLAGPGQRLRAAVAVHPDQRGTFVFYCRIPGHREGGMEGRITVR
jgi:plastocyanin